MVHPRSIPLIALSTAILLLAMLPSCSKQTQRKCALDDNEIIRQILTNPNAGGGYVVVDCWTSIGPDEGLPRGLWKRQVLDQVEDRLDIPGCDVGALVKRLLNRNDTTVLLEIESEPDFGYVIDTDSSWAAYFRSKDDLTERWERFYEDDPNRRGITSVSLPVCDAEANVVLIYHDLRRQSLVAQGWISAYRIEDGRLVEIDGVILWIS
jgi:hypothetical protein